MSKNKIQYIIIAAGILSLLVPIIMLTGWGQQDRPGVRFGPDHDAGPTNRDYAHNPDLFPELISRLTYLVRGPDANKARRSANTLGNLGARAKDALDALKERKDHPVERTREAINLAIEKIERGLAGQAGGGNEGDS